MPSGKSKNCPGANHYREFHPHMALRFISQIAVSYFLFCMLTYLIQRRLLYYPDRNRPADELVKSRNLAFWPSSDKTFQGYIGAQDGRHHAGLLVVFHGNAGSAWLRDFYIRMLGPLGYRVLLAEYPGYGGRPGTKTEKELVQDAQDMLRLAYEQFGGPVYVCGESLGCGVAAAVAADPPVPVDGVVLITPWDTLPNLAQSLYWYLPAKWLTKDKFDNIKNLSRFPGRVAVAVVEHDEIIPQRHSMRLYKKLRNEKRLWTVAGAGHNSWPDFVDTEWWRDVMSFLKSRVTDAAGFRTVKSSNRVDS